METQSTFSFAIFQNKFTRWHIKLSVYQCKNKSTSHIQYLFGHLFSRNAKKTHADQMIVQVFLALSEKKHLTNLQKKKLRKTFSQVCMLLVQLASMNVFLFHMITGRRYFLHKFTITQRIFANTALLRSLK